MKILAVSTWFPYPPDNGVRMRAYNLLKPLGEKHTLDLIAISQSPQDETHLADVHRFCRRVALCPEPDCDLSRPSTWRGFFSATPRYFIEHHIPEMQSLAHEWTDEADYDVAIAVTFGAAPYVAELPIPHRILDQHNVECRVIHRRCVNEPILRRLRYIPTWLKAERFEGTVASKFDAIAVVSEHERELMRMVLKRQVKSVRVVPNGVDSSLLDYDGPPKDPGLLIFTGSSTYQPNYDAAARLCREVLPAVRAQLGKDIRLKITGDTGGTDVSSLASCPGAEFTGYIEDLRPVLASATALIVPLRFGGGTRLKILEAMAIGTPVVSTSMGAEGIGAEDGVHILLGETSEELAAQTCRLLTDQGLATEIARNAREFVRERYQWPAIAAKFERMLYEG